MFLNAAYASNQSPPACTHFSQRSGEIPKPRPEKRVFRLFHPVLDSAHDFSVGLKVFTTEAIFQGTKEVKI